MFPRPLSCIQVDDFDPTALSQSCDLQSSIELSNLLQLFGSNKVSDAHIFGEPGSGCSTIAQGICEYLQQDGRVKKSELLYISVNPDCNEASLWNLMSDKAKEKQENDTASLLLQTHVKKEKKLEVLASFIKKHYKVFCIDNANLDESLILTRLVPTQSNSTLKKILVQNSKPQETQECDTTLNIEIKGLKRAVSHKVLTDGCKVFTLSELQISKVCDILNDTPVALQLFCAFVNANAAKFQSFSDLDGMLTELSGLTEKLPDQGFIQQSAVSRILAFVCRRLTRENLGVLYQLCYLRRPLPLKSTNESIEELLQLSLLSLREERSLSFVSVSTSLRKCLPFQEINFVDDKSGRFDVLHCWLSLVSEKLKKLISDAEENAWPFVPEKWQYVQKVGTEENYNIKELITSKNATVTLLTELEILHECLYHAYVQKDFTKLAALVLVMDRFMYWEGSSETSLQVVDYLQQKSPQTPIAPQLLIRKARVMKNTGNLQGAEETIDRLLLEKSAVGQWKYREVHDHQLVSGVCVQIKGDIQYTLGHWAEAARLLIRSVEFFGSLPKPDKKGLASSYGLLCACLRNMTVSEYSPLVQSYGLLQCHPLLAAYFSGKEASSSSVYTPMFFLRHICKAGEIMLEFSRLASRIEDKQQLVCVAIDDLKDSIQAHQTFASLASREQFYLLVCAVFNISLACLELQSPEEQNRGHVLKMLSMSLYEHYCSFAGRVVIDELTMELIRKCLRLLELEEFCKDDLPNAGEVLLSYFTKRTLSRAESNTSLASLSLFAEPRKSVSSSYEKLSQEDFYKQKQAEGLNETDCHHRDPVVMQSSVTVDKSAVTLEEGDSDRITDQEVKDCATVDRTSSTVEAKESVVAATSVVGLDVKEGVTVDRSAVTQDEGDVEVTRSLQDCAEDRYDVTNASEGVTSFNIDGEARGCVTVDRCAMTAEEISSDKERASSLVTAPGDCVTVDQCAMTVGSTDAVLWKYDSVRSRWQSHATLAYIGNPLDLAKGKKGAQRDALMVEYINQDEPMARYVAKKYKKDKDIQQYQQDVLCQTTARSYVALFNQRLYQMATGAAVGNIQFLPVALLQLLNTNGEMTDVYNVEPYMSGEFTKLTNNLDYVVKGARGTNLVLAFSHFSYQASDGKLIIVDIQGWTPKDNRGCTFLTDPQIHSDVYGCFGTGNLKQRGFERFWAKMHPECNAICELLGLVRPDRQCSQSGPG